MNTAPHSAVELLAGMRAISALLQAEVDALLPSGVTKDRVAMVWNGGRKIDALAIPKAVTLSVVALRGRAEVAFSREQLEACSGAVERADVLATLETVTARLTGR